MDKEQEIKENVEEVTTSETSDEKNVVKEKKKEKKTFKFNKETEELKKQLQEKDDKILRLSAEMQNMRRRSDEERAKLLKYDGEKLILEILPILDNFEHAVLMDDTDLTDEVSKFLSGFKMIYGNMVDILKRNEITQIDCLHKPFDEMSMHAVLVDNSDDFDHNVVLDVLQKGYMYKDKVIRPAMVKVNQRESDNNAD